MPALEKGENILIVAHGNSLRALVMHLESLPTQQIVQVSISTGTLLTYELDDRGKLIRQDRV